MSHDTSLISTLAVGLVLAFVSGTLAAHRWLSAGRRGRRHLHPWLRRRSRVVQKNHRNRRHPVDVRRGSALLKDVLAVKRIAIPGALVQITAATLMGMGMGHSLGWVLVFGLSLSAS